MLQYLEYIGDVILLHFYMQKLPNLLSKLKSIVLNMVEQNLHNRKFKYTPSDINNYY